MNVENKKVSVLEQVRDDEAENHANVRYEKGSDRLSTIAEYNEWGNRNYNYIAGWDAAIDLLPVLFSEFINKRCIKSPINNLWSIIGYPYPEIVYQTINELYTYWKENILKLEDLK